MKSESKIKKAVMFLVLTMSTGVIFKLPYIQDVFYVPMQQSLNLTHSQIGNLLSVAGLVSTFGFLGSMYFIDRISKKILIPLGLIGVGITGLYFYTFPTYKELIIIWISFALFSDMLYWPLMVKSVKELGNENTQGRAFGFFEAGRGLFDSIAVFIALSLFHLTQSLKSVILFYSIATILMGIVSFLVLEKEEPKKSQNTKKNGVTLEVIKSKYVWLVAGNIFCAYAIYCGLTYMMPYLQSTFSISVVLIGIFGMVNQYGIKILVGPLGGYLADKKFKSPSKYFRFSFILVIVVMMILIILPQNKTNIGFALVIVFAALVSSMKAILFAPMEEVKIDENISGTAISLAGFIGYAPLMFCYSLYGNILDKFEGAYGYKILFATIIAFGMLGLFINNRLIKTVQVKNKN